MIETEPATDTATRQPLPQGWRWVRLGDVCELNPPRPRIQRAEDQPTSFIPMVGVKDEGRGLAEVKIRSYGEVRKGYTYFAPGDVLFAKITPCMQNGKIAVADGLIDDVGFGSTEFHVLRPSESVLAQWLQLFLQQNEFLRDAAAHMTGTVGQQRLPEQYLAKVYLPIPPVSDQKRIAAILREQLAAVERARVAAEAQLAAARQLPAAYLRAVFESDEERGWPLTSLGEILSLRKDIVHQLNSPRGPAVFVGLEHIESHTGRRIGSLQMEMAELTGRKPRFYRGDLVYGYLRPYLNKVWIAEFDGLCSVDQYVYQVDKSVSSIGYISWFMRSPMYLERAPIDVSPGQLPRIRTEEVAAVMLNLPPHEVQQRVAAELDERMEDAGRVRESLEAQLTAINQLPAALLR
ncbi:MAG: restriction endonuclease subunit S, partial [Ktedonobacterales bacterium]